MILLNSSIKTCGTRNRPRLLRDIRTRARGLRSIQMTMKKRITTHGEVVSVSTVFSSQNSLLDRTALCPNSERPFRHSDMTISEPCSSTQVRCFQGKPRSGWMLAKVIALHIMATGHTLLFIFASTSLQQADAMTPTTPKASEVKATIRGES